MRPPAPRARNSLRQQAALGSLVEGLVHAPLGVQPAAAWSAGCSVYFNIRHMLCTHCFLLLKRCNWCV